jgi:transposase/AcrR family transcriptional regulator
MHRLLAVKRLGKDKIKAEVVELENELEARLLAIEKNMLHGIPLDREEKKELVRLLYADGVEIEKLRKLFRVSERTVYNWVEGVKRRAKDEELKRQALELRKQGLSQQEVAKRLGVARNTISVWENETQSQMSKPAKIAVFDENGTPTEEGFKALSEFIEEHEQELKDKPFNEVVGEQVLRGILRFLNEKVKGDFKKLIDADNYEKVKNYLMGMPPYKGLSLRARKVFFDKAQVLWEEMKKEHEKRKQLESLVLEKAKEVLSDPGYQFSTWKNLRFELSRRGIHGKEELIDEILHRHADELLAVYKQIPEAEDDSLTEEELKEIVSQVKEGKDKWAREYKAREEIRQRLKAKGLRPVDSVVERFVRRVEELLKEEAKPTVDWAELEKIAEDIEKNTPEEVWEEIRKEYEKQTQKKTKEKKEKTLPPDIEEWYRDALEELLLDMGIKLGWVRAFQIADEVYQKVKEFSKKAVRGW